MWEMMSNMMPYMGRMMPGRRNRRMNTATAMLLGAGIGIATWEVMRRTNAAGTLAAMGNMGNQGLSDSAIAEVADQMMDTIK
jgi:hypothetical protein